MGEILFRTKLSEEMFEGLRPWLNRVPGPADAHHHPRLRHLRLGVGLVGRDLRHHLQGRAARAASAAATTRSSRSARWPPRGTLGILIPPSITMVVYAVAADASIIRIFLAGFLPGLPADGAVLRLHRLVVAAQSRQGAAGRTAVELRRRSCRKSGSLIPCALLIVFIVWVLIAGWATATECAAYGVLGSLAIAWLAARTLTWQNFWRGLMGATRVSCMIMFILAGAAFLTKTMAFTGIPRELAEWVDAHAA